MEIIRKTNGYSISETLENTYNKWYEYITSKLNNIEVIDIFYYGENLLMITIRLNNKYYAHFNIMENVIHLDGYITNSETLSIFESATLNDELYKGQIK